MSAQIIKASEVRAGDTLRVTFDFTVTPGLSLMDARGKTWFSSALEAATTIERLTPALKVGDRVRHVCGIERPVTTLRAIVDDYGIVYSGLLGARPVPVMLADLRLAERPKVDGVFEVGDRVNLKSSAPQLNPGFVISVGVPIGRWIKVDWLQCGVSHHNPNDLRHEPAQ